MKALRMEFPSILSLRVKPYKTNVSHGETFMQWRLSQIQVSSKTMAFGIRLMD